MVFVNQKKNDKCLFIIWNSALNHQNEILNEIKKTHKICDIIDSFWDLEACRDNFQSFYSEYLPNLENKIKECGYGAFKIIITSPNDKKIEPFVVKGNILSCFVGVIELKKRLRQIAGGVHNVHISNNIIEYQQDYNYFFTGSDKTNLLPMNKRRFDTIDEFLKVASKFRQTVLLRMPNCNMEKFDAVHDDIDLLVVKRHSFAQYFGLERVKKYPENKRYSREIGGIIVYIDLHTPHDNEIDPRWCWSIIEKATIERGINTICSQDAYYLELYRFMFLKKQYAINDLRRLSAEIDFEPQYDVLSMQLKHYLSRQNYKVVLPNDPKTYFALYRTFDEEWQLPFYRNLRFYSRKHLRVKINIYKDFVKRFFKNIL